MIAPVLLTAVNFPDQLIGASLKQWVNSGGAQITPDFPDQLIGASLKPDTLFFRWYGFPISPIS